MFKVIGTSEIVEFKALKKLKIEAIFCIKPEIELSPVSPVKIGGSTAFV